MPIFLDLLKSLNALANRICYPNLHICIEQRVEFEPDKKKEVYTSI